MIAHALFACPNRDPNRTIQLPMCGMSSAGIANIYNGSGRHIIFVKSIPLFVQVSLSAVVHSTK